MRGWQRNLVSIFVLGLIGSFLAVAPNAAGASLSLGASATQSSTDGVATADLAIDGNAMGHESGQSYARTTLETDPWWEVDLGAVIDIGTINVWEHLSCCPLGGVHVLVSDVPFTGPTLADAQATPGVFDTTLIGTDVVDVITVGRTGRYVRVQAAGSAQLALAEVQVLPPTIVPDPLSTYVVDATDDAPDLTPGDGLCATAAATCTLRAALTEANLDGGPSRVEFNIVGAGPHEIRILTPLPGLNDPTGGTAIDGTTQPGAVANTAATGTNAVQQIVVTIARGATEGFRLLTADNEIRGLVLHTLSTPVQVTGPLAVGNTIAGTWFGTDASGTVNEGNLREAILVDRGASFTVIGGPNPEDRTVVAGSGKRGIAIWNTLTNDTSITNSYLGLLPDGETVAGNGSHAIDINWGAARVTIGGDGPYDGNVISGNARSGIEMSHALGNRDHVIANNILGTNATATSTDPALGNGDVGINIEDRVNGTLIRDNLIVNHSKGGIRAIYATFNNTIRDNTIGVLPDGTPAGNGRYGILINRGAIDYLIEGNEIAYTTADPSNRYAYSGGAIPAAGYPGGGIEIDEPEPTDRSTLRSNIIYGNAGQAIDLAPIGTAEPNDPGDADNGPNQQLNYPEITVANPGSVSGTTCADCIVEVGVAEGAPGSTDGGVAALIGEVTADATGAFSVTDPALTTATVVTAWATDTEGNTSELAPAIAVVGSDGTPVASFTSTCDNFGNCTFDGSSSVDYDGTITAWDWDMGDGTLLSGTIVDHTYTAEGTYTVTLVITDDDVPPRTDTDAADIGIYAPLDDQFDNRTVIGGWGEADPSAGSWDPNWSDHEFSVGSGVAEINTPSSTSRRVTFSETLPTDVDLTFTVSADQVSTGGAGQTVMARARNQVGAAYQLRIQLRDDGAIRLRLDDLSTAIGSQATAAATHIAGQDLRVRYQLLGTNPTLLRAKVWDAGWPEPAAWDIVETDAKSSLQGPGGLTLGVATNGATLGTIFTFDDIRVEPIELPTAAAAASCVDPTCTFDAATTEPGSNAIASYEWDTGDGVTLTGVNPSHDYAVAGTYTVTLTVTDTAGFSDSAVLDVTVEQGTFGLSVLIDDFTRTTVGGWGDPTPIGDSWSPAGSASTFGVDGTRGTISTAPGSARRIENPVQLTDVSLVASIDADATTSSWGRTLTASVRRQLDGSSYEIRVRLAQNGDVLIRPRADGVWLAAETLVPGLTHVPGSSIVLRFEALGSNPTVLNARVWDAEAAEPATWDISITDSTVELQAPGTIALQSYLSTAAGSPESIYIDDVTVDIVPAVPTAAFTLTCADLTCDFDGTGSMTPVGTITAWDWDFGDATTGAGATTQHTFAGAGTYDVALRVTNSESETDEIIVTVDVPNLIPTAAAVGSCVDALCSLDGSTSSDADGSIVDWQWTIDGVTLTGEFASHTITGLDGTYPVELTVTDNRGASATTTFDVVVDRRIDPVADFTVDCDQLTCSFDGSGSSDVDGTIATWDWDFGDGITATGITTTHAFATAGTSTVTLTVTDDDGDTHVATTDVTTFEPLEVDDFTRTEVDGWGTGPLGTAWTPATAISDFSVDSTRGVISTPAGASRVIEAGGISVADVSVLLDFTVDATVTEDRYVRLYLREQASDEIQVRVRVRADGTVRLRLRDPSGWLGAEVTIADNNVGQTFRLRVEATGDSLQARVWDAANAEPTTWTATGTLDASVLGAGTISLGTWLSSTGALNSTTTFDNLTIQPLPGG